jgi:hypothetical protein
MAARDASNCPFQFCSRHVNVVVPIDRSVSDVRQRADNHFGGSDELAGQVSVSYDNRADAGLRIRTAVRIRNDFHVLTFRTFLGCFALL